MAKTRAYGADATLLAAFETTYGTPPDGSGDGVYRPLAFGRYALSAAKPLGYDPILGQGRNAQDPFYEAVTVQGDIQIPVDLRGIGFWLRLLMGAPVTTGSGDPYTHVFKSGGALPSAALELTHTQFATPYRAMAAGVKANTLQCTLARTGPSNATIGLIAQGETYPEAAEDADPLDAYALTRFNQGRGQIKLGGSQLANVTGGGFSFSNNLEAVETIRPDGLIDGADETEATCELSIDVRFGSDATIRTAIDAETPVALSYGWSIPGEDGYSLVFDMPRVFLPRVGASIDGPGGIQQSYSGRAAYDVSAGYMLRATLINDVASYA